jgi:hypothetical protein
MNQPELRGHQPRVDKSIDIWLSVATDFNGGMEPKDIAKRYISPKTGKHYTREHIYWMIKQLKVRNINITEVKSTEKGNHVRANQ